MQQESFNEYVSSVLKEFGIENKIVCQPYDPRLSHYDIVVKIDDDDLIFHTFAYGFSWENVESFCCYFDKSNQEFFDVDFTKYYNTRQINSSCQLGYYIVKPKLTDVENEIKKLARENIVQTLKQLKLIEQ